MIFKCLIVLCGVILPIQMTAQEKRTTVSERELVGWKVLLIKKYQSDSGSFHLDACWNQEDKSVCRDFGVTEDYRAFYVLPDSMLDNVFVLIEFWEHNGMVHILFHDGEWVSLHGSAIAIDGVKRTLSTKAVGDMQQTVGRISLSSREVEEKEWNNGAIEDPWDTGLDYYFPSNDAWLR